MVGEVDDDVRWKRLAMMPPLLWWWRLRRWRRRVVFSLGFGALMSLPMEMGMEPPVSGVPVVLGLVSESESESWLNLLGGRWYPGGEGEAECCAWRRPKVLALTARGVLGWKLDGRQTA
jgi:hypothetical protein